MNYLETVNWMFNQLPMYQNIGATAYKANLSNTIALCEHLGNPQNEIKTIHVAGTNGKGSTSHMLASILQEAGYKTGLYTSPHLKDFRERIKINGEEISAESVVLFIDQNKSFLESHNLSFFEMTVGLAFEYFAQQKVDIAIIEVGLGGRLDATNVITPLVSVITNIDIDHVQFLGNTIALIAAEKGGIIKPEIPVIVGEYSSESKSVFEDIAQKNHAPIYYASDLISESPASDLNGDYQQANKKTVLQTLKILQSITDFRLSPIQIENGFLKVIHNTKLQGRWQKIHENPTAICDTAHNRHGLSVVISQLEKQEFTVLRIVLGVVNDKDLEEILPLFPKSAKYYFCKPNIFRGLEAKILASEALKFGLNGEIYNSVSEAYAASLNEASNTDLIFVGGSTFVVAEIL